MKAKTALSYIKKYLDGCDDVRLIAKDDHEGRLSITLLAYYEPFQTEAAHSIRPSDVTVKGDAR